jgi:hypothetical protein
MFRNVVSLGTSLYQTNTNFMRKRFVFIESSFELFLPFCRYNVFTSHGPDLYGTEPASFYLLNGLLNFNVAFPAALAVIPLQLLLACLLRREPLTEPRHPLLLTQVSDKRKTLSCSGASPTRRSGSSSPPTHSVMCIGVQCGLYLWLAVFWSQPHKEERFFFPSYPLSHVYCVCSVGYISGWLCSGASPTRSSGSSSPPTRSVMCIGVQCGLYLWLAVFWSQPHKEERFLFPSYPLSYVYWCAVWAISLAGSVLEPAPQGGAVSLPLLPTQLCVLVCSVGYISGWLCSGASPTRRSSSCSPATH